MQLRVGYELIYNFPQATPIVLTLNIHYSRASDVVVPDYLTTDPSVPIAGYRDGFGNWCNRIVAPAGRIRIRTNAIVRDTGQPDGYFPNAQQHAVEDLPEETLVFLLGSRYCETDLLSQAAWDLFSQSPPGWARAQSICDYVHNHIAFDYQNARPTRTAWEVFNERVGVCRDYAHLAVTFCRCMNIPARYCTGYLSDVGTPPPWAIGRFCCMVRSLYWRWVAHFRSPQQRAADRTRAYRAGARCLRRGHRHHLWPTTAGKFQGLDG